ncbi:ubiquitin-associated/translation elongation factor EF1B protein [Tanacetum coccineum]
MYGRPSPMQQQQQQSHHNPMYGPASSLYPKIGGGGGGGGGGGSHPVNPPPPRHNTSSSSGGGGGGGGMGIRVTLKPDFRITPPVRSITRHLNYTQLPLCAGCLVNLSEDTDISTEVVPALLQSALLCFRSGSACQRHSGAIDTSTPLSWRKLQKKLVKNSSVDPVVGKYMAAGLNREAVPIAVAKYGDDPTKVREFVNGYTVLREMGFEPNSVAEALFTHNNDKEAAAHYLSV